MKYYSYSLARTPITTHKGVEKWPLIVNKQLFWWSASITLVNSNAVLTDLKAFFSLNIFLTYLSQPDWLYFYCFFSFEYFDPFDHYAACLVTLKA